MSTKDKPDTTKDNNEQLASRELDALVAEQDAALNPPAEAGEEFQPGQAPAPADMGNVQCVAMLLDVGVAMGKVYFPSLERTAAPDKCQQVAASVGAVLDKYGMQAGGWLTQYGAELGALVTCATFGVGVYAGIKADIAARQDAERKPVTAPAAPVTVTEQQPAADDPAANLPKWKDVGQAA